MKIPVYIFSYNRLQYLKNAINSVEKFYPYSTIYIVDDGSDDADMLEFIQQNTTMYNFIFPNSSVCGDRGGLYANLNYCVHHAQQHEYEHVLFMFDDIQIVRKVNETELINDINFLFENPKKMYNIVPAFFPITEKYIGIDAALDVCDNYYVLRDGFDIPTQRFNEPGVYSIKNFISLMETFENSERQNQKKCKERNLFSPHSCFPIGSRLPFQEYTRRGRDIKAITFLNKVSQRGFYPFEDMPSTIIDMLFNRTKDKLAYAEKWLRAPGVPQTIWSFWGESFGVELLGGDDEKELAEKLFWIENNVEDHSTADKMIIDLCETYLEDKKNSLYIYN